jgi:hypothetical protein
MAVGARALSFVQLLALRQSRAARAAQGGTGAVRPSGANWLHEIEHDGYRLIVRRDANVDHLPGDLRMPSFGPRMVCTKCGTIGADVRPNWREYGS